MFEALLFYLINVEAVEVRRISLGLTALSPGVAPRGRDGRGGAQQGEHADVEEKVRGQVETWPNGRRPRKSRFLDLNKDGLTNVNKDLDFGISQTLGYCGASKDAMSVRFYK